ncbi:MAG: NAD(P)H-hydrate dehydratase [Planctomycetaceae bacterium]|nr:NAD(P)H-hydrate dehydratase [Planctomycetaceae bacterium]
MATEIPPLRLPDRPADGHKGTFGSVLIVAGSLGMSGAAALAGLGALRGGAGLVYLAVPESIAPIVASIEPSYLTIPLPEDKTGKLSIAACPHLFDRGRFMEAVAIGPGWGQSDDLRRIVTQMYAQLECPMVVDADALNLLAGAPESLSEHAGQRILTPHPGEFARLDNVDTPLIQADRRSIAAAFAERTRTVVLLKGRETVITDGKTTYVNPTGNSGMATGGTGDVLTGLITALLAQGLPPLEAARTGAYLHGLAGDLAASHFSEPALIASDLPRYLGRAWKVVLNRQSAGEPNAT